MNVTKSVRSQKTMHVAFSREMKILTIQDDSDVSEVALALAEDAIAAAVKFVEEEENPIKNIKWITHGEFTAERGRRQIDEFVSTWDCESHWVCYTEFVERKDLIHSFHYIYCVRWSMSTARRPMARVSAAVYFTIKINKGKPPDAPIDVSYTLEDQSLVQRPGMIRFREKWLTDIIETKNDILEILASNSIFIA
ncbi:PREDICTED: A-kinase anchor protein 14 [Galeopterus variegatus]|uniref:A-kinase anchor protein 14 n=1 Tax=Galeopterus variegatus TaxID=482537 RepID=A0ABM0S5X8_GALVR|nr:PREDICTED: A-kinase anchor protein 14 [Galeopterus variegatus]